MAWTVLIIYLAGILVAFGLRGWLHYRATGDTGHRHSHPPAGTPAWWAMVLLALGLIGGIIAPLLAALAVEAPIGALTHPVIGVFGLVVALTGFVGVPVAQHAMGRSWRVGVDAGETTALVTTGVFRWVRNPVFTAMITAMAGLTAMNPTLTQFVVLACVTGGIQVQVRAVEEPYLRATHGEAYRRYADTAGRFLPRVREPRRPVARLNG